MTQKEFYQTIISSSINDEITAYAEAAIQKIELANQRKQKARAEKDKKFEPYYEKILEVLTKEPVVASEIATKVGLSVPQTVALMKKLKGAGLVEITQTKIKGKGIKNLYNLV